MICQYIFIYNMYICLSICSGLFYSIQKKKDELKKEEGEFSGNEDDKRQRQRQGLLLFRDDFLYICSSFSILFTLHTSASTVERSKEKNSDHSDRFRFSRLLPHCISPCPSCMFEQCPAPMDPRGKCSTGNEEKNRRFRFYIRIGIAEQ